MGGSAESRRAAQLPKRPSSLQQFHIKGAICEPLHRGPISGRIRIGNLCLSACRSSCSPNPNLMDKPSLQTTEVLAGARSTTTLSALLCPLFEFSTGAEGCQSLIGAVPARSAAW
jgi:hypothetical protein